MAWLVHNRAMGCYDDVLGSTVRRTFWISWGLPCTLAGKAITKAAGHSAKVLLVWGCMQSRRMGSTHILFSMPCTHTYRHDNLQLHQSSGHQASLQ